MEQYGYSLREDDHRSVAMPFSQDKIAPILIDKNEFTREVLLEAVVLFVEEKLMGYNSE